MRKSAMLSLGLAIGICSFYLQAQVDHSGSPIEASPPTYPLAARAAGIEGKVVLKGIVGEDGRMKSVQVIKGPPELRQAASDAVMRWTFRPYTRHGKAVPVTITTNVMFTLGNKKEKAEAMAEAKAALAKTTVGNSDPSAR